MFIKEHRLLPIPLGCNLILNYSPSWGIRSPGCSNPTQWRQPGRQQEGRGVKGLAFSIGFVHWWERDCVRPRRIDPYGFERQHDYDSYKEMMSEYVTVLNRRSMRWSKLLQDKPNVEKNLTGTNINSHNSNTSCWGSEVMYSPSLKCSHRLAMILPQTSMHLIEISGDRPTNTK